MSFDAVVFGVTFIVTLGASLAMVFAPNAIHVALFLVVAQVGLAVTFLLQGAFFIAAIQIIVYAGAIMVLFLFVIMLLGVDRREALIDPLQFQRPAAIALGALLTAEILWIEIRGTDLVLGGGGQAALERINEDPGNVLALARLLFSRYLLPFEVTSVLLVVAIVGVMVLARRIGSIVSDTRVPGEAGEEEAAA